MVATSPIGSSPIGDLGGSGPPRVVTGDRTLAAMTASGSLGATVTMSGSPLMSDVSSVGQLGATVTMSGDATLDRIVPDMLIGLFSEMVSSKVWATTSSTGRIEAYDANFFMSAQTLTNLTMQAKASLSMALEQTLAQVGRSISLGASVTVSLVRTLAPTGISVQARAIRRRVASVLRSLAE